VLDYINIDQPDILFDVFFLKKKLDTGLFKLLKKIDENKYNLRYFL
jgi:hypothetical protein